MVVVVELVGEQTINYKIPVDETNSKFSLDSLRLGRSDFINLEERISSVNNECKGEVRTKSLLGRLKYGPVLSPMAQEDIAWKKRCAREELIVVTKK